MNVCDSEFCVNNACKLTFPIFAGDAGSEYMVALWNNLCAHVHEEKERVTRSEETQNVVRNVQQKEAEHHDAARLGERDLMVAPGVTVPRPSCNTISGDSQECLRTDSNRLPGESIYIMTVRTCV